MSALTPLSVSAFNQQLRDFFEMSLEHVWLCGEVSNFTASAAGHWYFSLKDAQAQVRCVMFRPQTAWVKTFLYNGLQVEVSARVGVYVPRGEYQLQIEQLLVAGAGQSHLAREQLKQQLQLEGLLTQARKRVLPLYPERIGVLTSPQAAALADVLTTLARRWPLAHISFYPCAVQGKTAASEIVRALMNANARARDDVLLLVRGGGAEEDLQSFNDEAVVRAVAASRLPIVCGVGHARDVSLCEQVADLSAPTPTAAAELVTPDKKQLQQQFYQWRLRLQGGLRHCYAQAKRQRHALLIRQHQAGKQQLALAWRVWQQWQSRLHPLNPAQILQRGYVVLVDAAGKPLDLPLRCDQTVWLISAAGQQRVRIAPLPSDSFTEQ